MKITALIFTYRGDESLTPLCVEFIKETLGNDIRIVIADDGLNSMFYETQSRLKHMGVEYQQTSWYRNGNITGAEHLIGATELMAELAKDCDIILKIDPDACLLKKDWLERLYNDKNALMTASYKTEIHYPMGNAYAIKSCVCDYLAKDAKAFPGWRNCYEDYEIGIRIGRYVGHFKNDYSIRYVCGIDGGFALTTPWDIDYKTCLDLFRVYCSGYNYGSTNGVKRHEYRAKQIEVHTALLNEYKKLKNVMSPISIQVPESIANSEQNNYKTVELPDIEIPKGPINNIQYSIGNF